MLRGTSTDVKRSCGSRLKTSMHFFLLSFLSQGEDLHRPIEGSCSPMRVGKHLGRSEQADQEKMMTKSAYLQRRISDCTRKQSQRRELKMRRKRVRGTSPRRLRGLTVMAPRHIYNPTILRGRGRFPVQLSCAIALLGREAV